MRRFRTLLTLCLLAAVCLPVPAASQDLQTEFTVESRLLDRELDLYEAARGRERRAITELRDLSAQLDATFADPNVPLNELRRVEALLSAARETAFLRAKETGEVRFRIYDRMERLTQLALEIERRNPAALAGPNVGIDGLWQIQLEPIEVYGLMKLLHSGNVVSGSYRLSNGHRGSVQGTLFGDRVELNVIDVEQGQVGQLEGSLSSETRELSGRWNAMDLSAGRAAAGAWTAISVPGDDIDLDE